MSRFEEIRTLPLFAGIGDESFAALTRGAYVQNFPPAVDLINEGEMADFLYIVASGSVELYAGWNGRETSVAFLRPYDTFILAATIKNAPYLMSARTMTKSRLIMIPSENVRSIFEADTEFARAIVGELAKCYRASVRSLKNEKLRTAVERLANYIVKHYRREGEKGHFDLPVEKRKLAARLGMTPENLSRAFSALKNHGVAVEGSRIRIREPERLIAFARPDPLIDKEDAGESPCAPGKAGG